MASGLIDSHTGQADVLVLNGNTIEGHVGTTGGPLAFTITLDPTTGLMTFTEYRAVRQPFGTNPDGGEGVSLTAGIVNLTATITDKDGDFQTASLDLGSRLTITDDGPTIGGFDHATIVAKDNQVVSGTYNVSFGADGDSAMRVAIHDGAVNGYNLATTDLGGGITSVHVTGNGDDYTFYYTTQAVSGGVKLNAFFTDTSGTLSDPFFTLLINPDGTYTFDIQTVGFLQQTTVSGSDFGASSSGQPSLTAPDGLLVITGDFNGIPADVKASNNGIAVGDTGLQMDQQETLLLTFTPEQTDVSFHLTQWQGNGTADVVFKVYDGATDIHDFNINIPKPSGDAHILVEKTSNPALVNTYTFDPATSTYTLYVGSEFNQIRVSYDDAVTGNTTFTVNDITYSAGTTIPSTDLLFDVTAVDGDGDTATTSLQVDLVGSTNVASGLTLSSPPGNDVLVGGTGSDTLTDTFTVNTIDGTAQVVTITITGANDAAVISGTTTGSVIEAGGVANAAPGAPTATGTLTDADADNSPNTFTAVNSPTASAGGYGTFTITAAGVWIYTLNNANNTVQALNVGDTLTDTFTVATIDGTAQLVTITITGANDAAVISGTTTGSVIEAGATPGTPTATGALTDSDVDNTSNTFTAVSSPAASAGGYGTFTMTATGVWTYRLDDTNSVVQALDVGDTLTDTFTVTAVDGTAQQVTITIHGASDAGPNDFDYLATGTVVISDPPFVYGTPRGDSIAGGGNDGQIIYGGAGDDTLNGTGQGDNIYGGSGNDTIKGNDGDDTIYGGSGSDTINANNGNDTIIGGFGANKLTGSNGDDRFVYLSVADSNAAQFDVISDFRSGSDRIDLAALGALAFLALTSTSTSVPAHTIAWIYDSAANETIVYVNPTDQTLSIGASGLLEIHLQGIVSVDASDFVYAAATASAAVAGEPVDLALVATAASDDEAIVTATAAEASSDWTVSDGALLTDASWTVRTIGERDSFVFSSDDEARTYSTESTNDDAAIATPTSGPPVEVQQVNLTTPTTDNLALDQKPGLDATLHVTNFVAPNNEMAAPPQVDHSQTLDDDVRTARSQTEIHSATHSNTQSNEDHGQGHDHEPPTVKDVAITEHAHGHASHVNSNVGQDFEALEVQEHSGNHHSISGELNKHDTASKHGAPGSEPSTAHEASGSAAAHTHGLGDTFHFKDKISAPAASDVVEDIEVDPIAASTGHPGNAVDPNGPPTISEIAQLIELSPPKHHPSDDFNHGGGHMGNGHAHAALDLIV
ncbi:VCBS domain-containing protein [Bradyrhizobium sp. AUGA SZCCT0283]|nr:VCBS domain-containing protein [Bradyrhizobium sp. AUGA SZCCT0283]